MAFAVKTLFAVLIAAVVGGFAINHVPALKQKVVEVINPAAKERRLLGELTENLEEISQSFSALDPTDPDYETKIEDSKNLLKKSKELLQGISDAKQNTGVVRSQIGKIIDTLIDKTPFPADHIQGNASNDQQIPLVCPPPQAGPPVES